MTNESERGAGGQGLRRFRAPLVRPAPADHGPDVTPHLAIYRRSDGYATFHRYVDDPENPGKKRMQNLFAVPVADLRQWFPSLAGWLIKDAYASVNTFYGPYPFPSPVMPDLRFPDRREKSLRYLCAAYCDIDVGRLDDPDPAARVTAGQAIGMVYDLVRAGALPPVSMYAQSGRGVYVFWFLQGACLDEPHRLYRWNHKTDLALYKGVNKALQTRIRGAGAYVDPIHDASRYLRVHGSIHSGSGQHTTYLIAGDELGGYAYALYDLAEWLGLSPYRDPVLSDTVRAQLEEPEPEAVDEPVCKQREPKAQCIPAATPIGPPKAVNGEPSRPKNPVFVKSGKRGARKGRVRKAQMRLTDVLAVEQYQGGFVQGRRRQSLTYLARFMVDAGTGDDDIRTTLDKLAVRCRPPYPSDPTDVPVSRLVTAARRRADGLPRGLKNDVLAKFFDVTPDMARELGLESVVPAQVRQERDAQPSHRERALVARRQAIVDRLNTHPADAGNLSFREWTKYLVRECGAPPSLSAATVYRDFRALEKDGLITPGRGGRGRPRMSVSQ